MSEGPLPTPPLNQLLAESGLPFPNQRPFPDVTLAIVVWNDRDRLLKLLRRARPFFGSIAVAVQDSPDDTAEVAHRYADIVVTDVHRGYGDATFGPMLLPSVLTRWTLKLDADEWPSPELLKCIATMVWFCEHYGSDGLWIPFRSWVEGGEYTEQHSHMRLFETRLGWPGTLHSRPPTKTDRWWAGPGHIRHVRSLDEMMQDYLRYWDVGQGNRGWEDHNRLMMLSACTDSAKRKGWAFVQSFDWWPRVEAIAFSEEKPWQQH